MMETWWCEGLRNAIADPAVAFIYRPHSRVYGIRVFKDNKPLEEHTKLMNQRPDAIHTHAVFHCPWCGVQLPYDLQRNHFRELEQHGVEDVFLDVAWPPALQSDQWWKESRQPLPNLNETIEALVDECIDNEGNFGVASFCPYILSAGAMGRSPFTYQAHIREYGIRRFQPGIPVWSQPLDYVLVQYSPWCGRRFAYSLKRFWRGMLDACEVDPERDYLADGLLNDFWWRDRHEEYADRLAGTRTPPDNPCAPPPDQVASPN